VKILIAPDKFRDALSAQDAAQAIASGVRDARPSAEVVICPLGDGGEGTGQILANALGAEQRTYSVLDPLGRRRDARWWLATEQRLAIIEMAEASGLALLEPAERDALRTSSIGTGQLLRAAVDAGCLSALLCVGGSATVDGGAGCLQGLGCKLMDKTGATISEPICGGDLRRVKQIENPSIMPPLVIEILCDVDNPLLGPRGAARVFGPQKGATKDGVELLERGLRHWTRVLHMQRVPELVNKPGAGAAGGLPFGLAAECDAHLLPGFEEVARLVRLHQQLAGCDLCITGEGQIDDQTAGGKTVAGVARAAGNAGVAAVALVGVAKLTSGRTLAELAADLALTEIRVVTPDGAPLDRALAQTAENLRASARTVVQARSSE
jgi:glycerate kinase